VPKLLLLSLATVRQAFPSKKKQLGRLAVVQLTSIQFMAYQKNNFYSGGIESLTSKSIHSKRTSLYTQISCVFPKKKEQACEGNSHFTMEK
jgi:hypothetical protein